MQVPQMAGGVMQWMAKRLPRDLGARLRSPAGIALGAGAATTVAGVVWRLVSGGNSESAPVQVAGLTAQAVANASRESVLAAFDGPVDSMMERLQAAAEQAMRETASAGADVTASAVGAMEGASIAARQAEADTLAVLLEVETRVLAMAAEIGEPALQRVRQVIDGRRW